MKFLIASDIHGSATWCAKLMDAIEAERPDRVILLGDLLYHGPRNDLPDGYDTKKVASMLNSMAGKIVAVRGNCDAEVDQMVLDFPCREDYRMVVGEAGRLLFCTHGHLREPEAYPTLPEGAAFLCGHTHVKRDETIDGIRVINPGSVSIPKDGTHSYAVYEDGDFRFETLS